MFPSLQCWLAALRLSIPNYLGFSVFTFSFWNFTFAGVMLSVASGDWHALALCMGIAGATLLIGIIAYLLLSLLWFGVLKLLWSQPPIAIAPNWVQMPVNLAISLVAVLPIALIFAGRLSRDIALEAFYKHLPHGYVIDLMFRFYWLWLLVAAYSYHIVFKCFKRKNIAIKKTELN